MKGNTQKQTHEDRDQPTINRPLGTYLHTWTEPFSYPPPPHFRVCIRPVNELFIDQNATAVQVVFQPRVAPFQIGLQPPPRSFVFHWFRIPCHLAKTQDWHICNWKSWYSTLMWNAFWDGRHHARCWLEIIFKLTESLEPYQKVRE